MLPPQKPHLSTRLLSSDDAPAFRELRLTSLQTDPEMFIATFEQLSRLHVDHFAAELESLYQQPAFGYWGMFDQDQLKGFYLITQGFAPKMSHTATIQNLYLHPELRGHHIASDVLLKSETFLLEHTAIEILYLETFASNQPARKLYRNLGYQRCGSKKHAIKLPGNPPRYDDLLFLMKSLHQVQ